jgi:hypothetical protein
MYNKYSSMKKSQLKEAIKAEIKSVLSENRYDINDPNSPMGKLNDEYESSGLKGIVDKYGLDVVLMMLSSGEYGDRLNEAMSDEERENRIQHLMRTGAKEKPLRKLAAIGKKEDEKDLKEVYQTNSKMSQIVSLFQDMMDDEYDGMDYRKALNDVLKAIDDDYKAAEREGEKFSSLREEDEEPTSAELKKKDSVASISNKLQKLTAKMKKKAKEFKEAEGKAKDKIKDELKDMTAEKKKLEKDL